MSIEFSQVERGSTPVDEVWEVIVGGVFVGIECSGHYSDMKFALLRALHIMRDAEVGGESDV